MGEKVDIPADQSEVKLKTANLNHKLETSKMNHTKLAILGALALVSSGISSWGQHTAETTPRAGETRLNQHQFWASHNSYEHAELQGGFTIPQLLDWANVWEIELDARWINATGVWPGFSWSSATQGLYVIHFDGPFGDSGRAPLKTYLESIKATQRFKDGFFFLNIEQGVIGTDPAEGQYMSKLAQQIESELGASNVYTYTEFATIDSKKWPSVQELLRRGKHVAIHVNAYFVNEGTDTMFFCRHESKGDDAGQANTAFLNSNSTVPLGGKGDRYFTRRYPTGSLFSSEHNGNWGDSYNNGYNFPTSNLPERRASGSQDNGPAGMNPLMHPPMPTYVNPTGNAGGVGTWREPYRAAGGLAAAVTKAKTYNDARPDSPITLSLEVGAHSTGLGGIIDAPVVLTARGGEVRINP